MIIFKKGDIFKEKSEAIVNPVNCMGVMGKGLALQFKKRFPSNYSLYREACLNGTIVPGKIQIVKISEKENPKYIVNFPTKKDWREPSRMEYIEDGLEDLKKALNILNISSISIPALGSGLGGLDWKKVKPLIIEKLQDMKDIEITIFEPF